MDLYEDFMNAWSHDDEKRRVSEVADFLFEAISGALEGPILHEAVNGVWLLLGDTNLDNVSK